MWPAPTGLLDVVKMTDVDGDVSAECGHTQRMASLQMPRSVREEIRATVHPWRLIAIAHEKFSSDL